MLLKSNPDTIRRLIPPILAIPPMRGNSEVLPAIVESVMIAVIRLSFITMRKSQDPPGHLLCSPPPT